MPTRQSKAPTSIPKVPSMNETPPVDPQPWMAEPVSNAVQAATQAATTPVPPPTTTNAVTDTVAQAVAQANQAAQSAQADAQAQIDAAMKAAQQMQDSILQANQAAMAMSQGGSAGSMVGMLVMFAIYAVILVVVIASQWKIFTKAGKPGWAAIVPIYNILVFLEVVGRPAWWIILMFVPFVNFIVAILLCMDLARKFGKGAGFGIGLVVLSPIFLPMLAFGDATYNRDA